MDPNAHRFFQDFPLAARERLQSSVIRQTYPDRVFLFREGDAADGVYLVLEGKVEILRTVGTYEKLLDVVEPGDYFGEVAVLDGRGRSTATRSRGPTTIARVPGDILLDVLATGPGSMAITLFRHVLPNLRKATDLVMREVVHKEKLSLVGEMASSLMHDLRTPVSSIRLSADLINATADNGKVPQWCDGIRLQCDRLVGMAAELMEFSKGESRLALTRTTITAFLAQYQSLNEGFLDPSGIEIVFKSEPGEVEIDVMRMQRVLQNLVTNAIEALEQTPKPRLDIRAWVKDAMFHLAVEDNGPGISEAIQGRIFEPFVTQGKAKGIGLGMAIVRNIVTAHGGTITFDTAPDRGTTFLVSVPQQPA